MITPAVVTEGRWLEGGRESEIVITRGLARSSEIDVGDVVEATTVNASASLTVVGIAIDTSFSPYPNSRPGPVFVTEATVRNLVGGPVRDLTVDQQGERRADFTVGVRIEDPQMADDFAAEVGMAYGGPVFYWRSWTAIRDHVASINDGPVIILRLFGFFGLLGAGIIVASAITGHVLSQIRDVGVLKASGFSPLHITVLFLGQQLALGLVAALTGVVLAVLATPLILRVFGELLYAGVSPEPEPVMMAGVIAAIGAMIVVFTVLPAWRSGRTGTVDALSRRLQRGSSKPSRMAKWAIRLHMPHVVVFGMKDVFARKTRATLTVAAVVVVAAVVMMTITVFGMLDRLVNDPTSVGAWPSELRVERLAGFGTAEAAQGYFAAGIADPIPREELAALIESNEEVDSYLTSWNASARVEEIDSWITTFIVSGPVDEFGFRVTEGRMFSAPNETVIGLGLAERHVLSVGEQVTVLEPLRTELTIVGKYVDSTRGGSVLMYGIESLPSLDAEGTLNLKLARGVEAADFARTLLAETGGRVVVTDVVQEHKDNLEDERALISLMLSLNGVLIALAATNLLIALVFMVRERTLEFGIMKTVGFTPGQIVTTVILGAAVLAIIGVVIGSPLGYYLARLWILEAADTQALPRDIIQLPSVPWLALMASLAVGLATLGAALPARRAARITVTEALRFE